jgi:hypothetical protein
LRTQRIYQKRGTGDKGKGKKISVSKTSSKSLSSLRLWKCLRREQQKQDRKQRFYRNDERRVSVDLEWRAKTEREIR